MTGARERCRGTTANGKRCKSPVVGPDGWCDAHRPGNEESMRARARKGAEATARRHRGGGLDPAELPALRTPQDAERLLELVAHAVATRRLGSREGDAVTRAVRVWLSARDVGALADRVKELEAALGKLKKVRAA